MSYACSADTDNPASLTLTQPTLLNQMTNHLLTPGWLYHFIQSTSLRAALSSSASASNRLSRLFSSSSSRSRLAYETSIPQKIGLPLVKGLFDDPQLPADVLGLDPGFILLDGPDDLFFCIPTALHIEFSSVQV